MSKDKKPDSSPQTEAKDADFSSTNNAPPFVLNSRADNTRFKEQANINLKAIRALLEVLPDEAIYQFEPSTLIYLFGNIERLVGELQNLLIESQ